MFSVICSTNVFCERVESSFTVTALHFIIRICFDKVPLYSPFFCVVTFFLPTISFKIDDLTKMFHVHCI